VGALGLASIKVLLQQNYKVSCWSRRKKSISSANSFSSLEHLPLALEQTDILINLLPLTPETKGLLNKPLLSNLPVGAKLINFSRGPVVDYTALLELLDSGKMSHAILDVFEQEPLTSSSPLWGHPQISILPHISAPTNMLTASQIVADNILQYRANKVLPTTVDLNRGY